LHALLLHANQLPASGEWVRRVTTPGSWEMPITPNVQARGCGGEVYSLGSGGNRIDESCGHLSSQVKEALSKFEFMARDRIGPIYMYGPIGSGKTSLVRRLQEKLGQDERFNVKLLISPNLKSSNAFLRLILETFDVKTERSYTASLADFEKFLIEQYQKSTVPVLLIDEAQYMNREHLKLIHYLLNFETNKTK
jgi:type II secretory pathway predicted ATPase ExeA